MTTHTTPVCPNCNYDLSGVPSEKDTPVICPECGTRLRSTLSPIALTKHRLARMLFFKLVLPTAIPPIIVFILVTVQQSISLTSPIFPALSVCILGLILVGMISIPPLWIIVSVNVSNTARPYPRPVPRWTIPLFALLALGPAMIVYIILYSMA